MRLTPEQKAEQLIKKFKIASVKDKRHAIAFAELCADEIIDNHILNYDDAFPNVINYWQSVKDALSKL